MLARTMEAYDENLGQATMPSVRFAAQGRILPVGACLSVAH